MPSLPPPVDWRALAQFGNAMIELKLIRSIRVWERVIFQHEPKLSLARQ